MKKVLMLVAALALSLLLWFSLRPPAPRQYHFVAGLTVEGGDASRPMFGRPPGGGVGYTGPSTRAGY